MAENTKKIIIADDEPDILNLLCLLFRSKGYEVYGVSDGEAALQTIEEQKPDAAILDFMMPKLDGISICRKVRETNQNMFIIIISGVGNEGLREHSASAQANHYLEKPLRMQPLLQLVKSGLARSVSLETKG